MADEDAGKEHDRIVSFMVFNAVDTKPLVGMYKIVLRNRFVFYNPYIDERILRMVFAHELGYDLYHQDLARRENSMMEYQLFDITTSTEFEANLFASHLLKMIRKSRS